MDKLKPCPFCGDEVDVLEYDLPLPFGKFIRVECRNCGAKGSDWDTGSRERAINDWNWRTDPAKTKMLNALLAVSIEFDPSSMGGDQDYVLSKVNDAIEFVRAQEVKP